MLTATKRLQIAMIEATVKNSPARTAKEWANEYGVSIRAAYSVAERLEYSSFFATPAPEEATECIVGLCQRSGKRFSGNYAIVPPMLIRRAKLMGSPLLMMTVIEPGKILVEAANG